jgi:PAT family beta-lactamase induction signal transducer AmpG
MGGVVVRTLGLRSSLWGSLGLMMGSNLLFSWLAIVGNSIAWLLVTIGIENLTGGVATAAFVAWLSAQCERRYAATQYALLTSLAALAHISLGAGSGWMADRVGWVAYFVWTAVASVPAVVLLLFRPTLVPAESTKSAEADATS